MTAPDDPQYTTTLLDLLAVGPDPIMRRDAIRAWLTTHEPSATLARSLRRAGYSDLLDT